MVKQPFAVVKPYIRETVLLVVRSKGNDGWGRLYILFFFTLKHVRGMTTKHERLFVASSTFGTCLVVGRAYSVPVHSPVRECKPFLLKRRTELRVSTKRHPIRVTLRSPCNG